MKIEFQDHFDPAYECIYLLTRHFAPPGDMHSVQDLTISLSEKHGIPLSEVEAITGPILEAETHILQHLHVPEETLRFYFDSARGSWATLGFALYNLQQEKIQFNQLSPQNRLPALRYLLSRILECSTEELEPIEDLPSLLRFLRSYPRIEHYKYACMQAFSDPEACQEEFAQIIQQAASLFHEIEAPFLPLISNAIQSFQTNPDPGILSLLKFVPEQSPIILIPTLMPVGSIALYESHESASYLYYGIFFDAIHTLNQKYSQDVNPPLPWAQGPLRHPASQHSAGAQKSTPLWAGHWRPAKALPPPPSPTTWPISSTKTSWWPKSKGFTPSIPSAVQTSRPFSSLCKTPCCNRAPQTAAMARIDRSICIDPKLSPELSHTNRYGNLQ